MKKTNHRVTVNTEKNTKKTNKIEKYAKVSIVRLFFCF